MLANHTLHALTSITTCAKSTVDSLVLAFRRGLLVSYTNSRYCAFEFRAYTYIKHKEQSNNFNVIMHILPRTGIHLSTQLASCVLTSISTPTRANFASSTAEKSFHPLFSSTVPRHLVEEMSITSKDYRLVSLISSCSFLVSEVMLQFPITSLWQDRRLRVVFKSPEVEELCATPICLPRRVAGASWGKIRVRYSYSLDVKVLLAFISDFKKSLLMMLLQAGNNIWFCATGSLF